LLFVIFAAFSCLFYEIKITSQSLAFCILHSSFYAAVSTGSVHTALAVFTLQYSPLAATVAIWLQL